MTQHKVSGKSMFRTMPPFTPATTWKCPLKTPLSGNKWLPKHIILKSALFQFCFFSLSIDK